MYAGLPLRSCGMNRKSAELISSTGKRQKKALYEVMLMGVYVVSGLLQHSKFPIHPVKNGVYQNLIHSVLFFGIFTGCFGYARRGRFQFSAGGSVTGLDTAPAPRYSSRHRPVSFMSMETSMPTYR